MKIIKRSVRLLEKIRKRYILIESITALTTDFEKEFCRALLNFSGVTNYSKMNLKIISKQDNQFIVRCNLDMIHELIVALCIIKDEKIGKAFYTIKSSGTISGLKRNL